MLKKQLLLWILMLSIVLGGCEASVPMKRVEIPSETAGTANATEPEKSENTPQDVPEQPASDPAPVEDSENEQAPAATPENPALDSFVLRVQDVPQTIMEALMNAYQDIADLDDDIPSFLLEDPESLAAFCNRIKSEVFAEAAASYGARFFEDHYLLVIPRITGSGSVRHQVEMEEEGIYTVAHVTATMPEVGTADMANWLIVVPLTRTEKVPAASMPGGWNPVPGSGFASE